MSPVACSFSRKVDAHFDGTLARGDAPPLFAHLPTCGDCKGRYERHLLLESLDPEAPGPKKRLERGLPLSGASPIRRFAAMATGTLAMAAGLLLAITSSRSGDGFHARGAAPAADKAHIDVYSVARGAPPRRVLDAVKHKEALAFAYVNPAGKKHLLVFATDEHRHVYWYYPAWNRPEDTPVAIGIVPTERPVELGDAITQDIDGRTVALHAIFSDDALTVRDVEARVATSPPLTGSLGFAAATETTQMLSVQ